jgi:hypothetical protein
MAVPDAAAKSGIPPASPQLLDGEREIASDGAFQLNYWGRSAGGKLILTDRRLLLTGKDRSKLRASWSLGDIDRLAKDTGLSLHLVVFPILGFLIAGIYGAGALLLVAIIFVFLWRSIRLDLKGGKSVRLRVQDREKWLGLIRDAAARAAKGDAAPPATPAP